MSCEQRVSLTSFEINTVVKDTLQPKITNKSEMTCDVAYETISDTKNYILGKV